MQTRLGMDVMPIQNSCMMCFLFFFPMCVDAEGNANTSIEVIVPLVILFVLMSIASLSLSVFAVKRRAKR